MESHCVLDEDVNGDMEGMQKIGFLYVYVIKTCGGQKRLKRVCINLRKAIWGQSPQNMWPRARV